MSNSNGPLKRDPAKIAYTKIERPIWPIDPDAKPVGSYFDKFVATNTLTLRSGPLDRVSKVAAVVLLPITARRLLRAIETRSARSPQDEVSRSLDNDPLCILCAWGFLGFRGNMILRLLAGLVALVLPLSAMAQEKVLRAVMHADVRVIDPIWTTQTIANIHGALVYDTLFGNDADQKPQPQMVGKYEVSADRLTYTFTLRDGLKFHDGSPVTTKDVIASLKRWGAKDGVGQRLMGYVVKMEAVDDKTFTMVLKRTLRHGARIARQERQLDRRHHAREGALTDPQQQVKELIGSGPFIFAKDQWVPGSKAVYLKNKDYVPRNEPPSGFAGGKIPGVDRIELIWISDPQTAMSALINGEIDFYENPNIDFLPLLEKAKGVKLMKTGKIDSTQGMIRLNHLHPPFDNMKARQAMYYLINQEDFLRAIVGDPKYYKVCPGLLTCGGPNENDGGTAVHEGVQSQEGDAAAEGGGLQGRADHRAGGNRPHHHHARDAGAERRRCARPASMSTRSRWTGAPWCRAAPRRSRRRRAAGTSSSPPRAASARPIRCCTPGSARPATRACSAGRAIPRSRSCATPSAWPSERGRAQEDRQGAADQRDGRRRVPAVRPVGHPARLSRRPDQRHRAQHRPRRAVGHHEEVSGRLPLTPLAAMRERLPAGVMRRQQGPIASAAMEGEGARR